MIHKIIFGFVFSKLLYTSAKPFSLCEVNRKLGEILIGGWLN